MPFTSSKRCSQPVHGPTAAAYVPDLITLWPLRTSWASQPLKLPPSLDLTSKQFSTNASPADPKHHGYQSAPGATLGQEEKWLRWEPITLEQSWHKPCRTTTTSAAESSSTQLLGVTSAQDERLGRGLQVHPGPGPQLTLHMTLQTAWPSLSPQLDQLACARDPGTALHSPATLPSSCPSDEKDPPS